MSPNPFAGRGLTRFGNETADPRVTFLHRLSALGATAEEVAQVAEGWDGLDLDPDERPEWLADRERLVALDDVRLRAEILRVRAEYDDATHTPEEQAERRAGARRAAAEAEAVERIKSNVAAILAWVGRDDVRARAIVELEQAGANRSTLIGPLEQLLIPPGDDG